MAFLAPLAAFVAKVGTAAAAMVGVTGLSAAATYAIGGALLVGGTILATKAFRLFDIEMPKADTDGARTYTTKGTIEPVKIVYGQALVSGPIVYVGVAGTENQDLYHAIALTAHECESINSIYFDDIEITTAQRDGSGNVTQGIFAPVTDVSGSASTTIVKIETHDGTYGTGGQNVSRSALLGAAFNSDWTANHLGKKIGYIVTKWSLPDSEKAAEVWDKYTPTNIKAIVKGVKNIYDPRDDTSVGANPTSATYQSWSDNPALCLAHYMTDTEFGVGIPVTKIDWQSVADAANDCDVTVDIPGGTEKTFTCNGVAFGTDSHKRNITKLLSSMNGNVMYANGKYYIQAGAFDSATESLNENDLRGPVSIKTSVERGSRFNTIKPIYASPSDNYKMMELPPVTVGNLATSRDNGEVLEKQVQFPFTNGSYMAQRLAHQQVNRSSDQRVLTFPANLKGMRIKVGDRVQVTLSEFGYTNKVFQCIGWRFGEGDAGGVDLTLIEDTQSRYTAPASGFYSQKTNDGTINSGFPGVSVPQSLTATGAEKRITVAWTNPVPASSFSRIYVYGGNSNVFANYDKVWQVNTETITEELASGTTRYYWVRAVKYGDGATSGNSALVGPASATASTITADSVEWVDVDNKALGIDITDDTITILDSSASVTGQEVAESGVDAGITLTASGGGIVMNQGGAIKSYLKDSESDTTAGFFLGWNSSANSGSGSYTFGVGDSSQNMQYADGVLSVTGAITATSGSIANSVTVGGTAASTVASGAAAGATALQDADTGVNLGLDDGSIGGITITSTSIESSNFSSGSAGFKLESDGTFETGNGTFRGTVKATSGDFSGQVAVGSTAGTVTVIDGNDTDYRLFTNATLDTDTNQYLPDDSSFKVGNDGRVFASNITIYNDDGDVLLSPSGLGAAALNDISTTSGSVVSTVGGTVNNSTSEITLTTTSANESFTITSKIALDDNNDLTQYFAGASTSSTANAEAQLTGVDVLVDYYVKADGGSYSASPDVTKTVTIINSGTPSSTQMRVSGFDRGASYSGSFTRYFAIPQDFGGALEIIPNSDSGSSKYVVTTASLGSSIFPTAQTYKIKIVVRVVEDGTTTVISGSTTPPSSDNTTTGIYFDGGNSDERHYEITGTGLIKNSDNTFTSGSQNLLASGGTVSGNLTVTGDFTVQGTTTTIDTANLNVEDKNITLNYGTGDTSANADSAGITIQDAVDADNNATILWDATNDEWDFSHGATFAGDISTSSANLKFTGTGGYVSTTGAYALRLQTNNTEALRLTSSQNAVFAGSITSSGLMTVTADWTAYYGSINISHSQNTLGGLGLRANGVYKGGLIYRDGTQGAYWELNSYESESIKFKTNNTVALTLDSSQTAIFAGNVTSGDKIIAGNGISAASPVLLELHNSQSDIDGSGASGHGNFINFKMTDDNATFTPQVQIGMLVKDYSGDGGIPSEGAGNFVVKTGQGTNSLGGGTLTERFRVTEHGQGIFSNEVIVGNASSSDSNLTVSSTDAYSGIKFEDPDDNDYIFYRGATNHFYLNSATFSLPGSTLDSGFQFQVNGDANIAGRHHVSHSETKGFQVTATDSTGDSEFYASRIDFNVSGSDTLTADRNKIALMVDMDSSASGGDTSDEVRLYGVYSDVRTSSDADLITAGHFYSRADNFGDGNQVTTIRSLDAQAIAHQDAGLVYYGYGLRGYAIDSTTGTGDVNNIYGVYGNAVSQSTSSVSTPNLYAGYFISQVGAALTNTSSNAIPTVHGVHGEIQIDNKTSAGARFVDNAYVFRAEYDENDSDDEMTVTNSYLFYGNYSGTTATNPWGVYIQDSGVPNYMAGQLRMGTGSRDAGSPSFTFNGDEDTGMYRVTTNQLGFSTGGTNRLTLNSSGATFAGDITAPNLRLTDTDDLALDSTAHAFQVGSSSGLNIAMDNNEIMARNNGEASSLHLNAEGGNVTFNNVQSGSVSLYMSGSQFMDSNRNLTNIGSISSGAITTTGNISLNVADGYVYLNNVGTGNSGIYVRGITSSNTLRSHSTNNFRWEVTGSQKMELDSSGNLDIAGDLSLNNNSEKFAAPVYRRNATATVNNSAFTTLFTVNGDNLGSAIRVSFTGTTSSVVVNVTADILVNHYRDIVVKSTSGFYTLLTLKVVSNNNEDFAVEAKTSSANALTLRIEVFPQSNEIITFTDTHSYDGTTCEHVCEFGEAWSGQDSTSVSGPDLRTTGRLFAANASASGVSYGFKADTDTGMFRGTTNHVSFAGGGTEFVRIGGNVLSVRGSDNPELELLPNGSVGNADFKFDGTNLDIASNSSSANLRLLTSSTERFKIAANGNVTATSSGDDTFVIKSTHSSATRLYISNTNATEGNKATIYFSPANSISGGAIISEATEDFSTSANRSATLEFHTRTDGNWVTAQKFTPGGVAQFQHQVNSTNSHQGAEILFEITDWDTSESIRRKFNQATTVTNFTKVDDSTAPASGVFEVYEYNNTYFGPYIPMDDDTEIIFECWAKHVSGDDTTGNFYAGSSFYNGSKTYLGNSSRYWGASGDALDASNTSDGWRFIRGVMRGDGIRAQSATSTAQYLTLITLFNYNTGSTWGTNPQTTRYCGFRFYRSKKTVTSLWLKTSTATNYQDSNFQTTGDTGGASNLVVGTDQRIYALNTASNDTPRFTFTGDTNTGLGYIGSDSVGLIAGGSRKFYTTTSNAYFQNLTGGVHMKRLTLGTSSEDAGELFINDTSTTSYTLGLLGTGTRGYTFRGSSSSGNYNLTFENAGTGYLNSFFYGSITANANSNGLTINSATNAGTAQITMCDNGTNGSGAQKFYITHNHSDGSSYGSGAVLRFHTTESTGTILADGKLMFSEGLYIKPSSGTGAGTVVIEDDGTLRAPDGSASSPSISFLDDSNTGFYRSTADGINIANGGSFTASLKAHVWDIFQAQNASNQLKFYNNRQDAGNVAVSKVSAYNSNAEVAKIEFYRGGGSSSGYVKIATKPINDDSLTDMVQFGGNTNDNYDTVFKGNVTAYGSPSDITLKENIEVIPDALNKVVSFLKGVTFNYKKDGSRSTGLLAQDLQKALPEVVYTATDIDTQEEHLAVRYGNTAGLLVEAIKELKRENDELKEMMKTIMEKINGDN